MELPTGILTDMFRVRTVRSVLLRKSSANAAGDGEHGFTLVETLVTIIVLLIMLAAIQQVLFAGFNTFLFGQDNFESQAKVELAHKYLDRALRETRSVEAADPLGRYVAVITDADNDGSDELRLYFVDYTDGKLKEYTDLTPY